MAERSNKTPLKDLAHILISYIHFFLSITPLTPSGRSVKASSEVQEFKCVPDLYAASGPMGCELCRRRGTFERQWLNCWQERCLETRKRWRWKILCLGRSGRQARSHCHGRFSTRVVACVSSQKVGSWLSQLELFLGKRNEHDSLTLPSFKQVSGRVVLA